MGRCWFHHFLPTGREAKEVAEDHGEFPNSYYKCIEMKCYKCPKTKWERRVLMNFYLGKQSYYTEEEVADLPLLQDLLNNERNIPD